MRILLTLLLTLLFPFAAHAGQASYFADAQNMRISAEFLDITKVRPNWVEAPPNVNFTIASGGFYFNMDKMELSSLSISINPGSVTAEDKDFTWQLLGDNFFSVARFDEIVITSRDAVSFDEQGAAVIDGEATLLGVKVPVKLKAKMISAENGWMNLGLFGDSFVILGFEFETRTAEHGIVAKSLDGDPLCDTLKFNIAIKGVRQY